MTPIEWIRGYWLHFDKGPDHKELNYRVQNADGNERYLRHFSSKKWSCAVVPLAWPEAGLYMPRLDAGALCGSSVFEFKTTNHIFEKLDDGGHDGVAVGVSKVEAMRLACGRGRYKYAAVCPFQQAYYLYWDMSGHGFYLTLDQIEEMIPTLPPPRPVNPLKKQLSYSIKSGRWQKLGHLGAEPVFLKMP